MKRCYTKDICILLIFIITYDVDISNLYMRKQFK